MEVLETSYKILNQPGTAQPQSFQEHMAPAEEAKPFEILEQTVKFFPRHLFSSDPPSNIPTVFQKNYKSSQAKITNTEKPSPITSQYTVRLPPDSTLVTRHITPSPSYNKLYSSRNSPVPPVPIIMHYEKNDAKNRLVSSVVPSTPPSPRASTVDESFSDTPRHFSNRVFGPSVMPGYMSGANPVNVGKTKNPSNSRKVLYGTPFYVQTPSQLTVYAEVNPAISSRKISSSPTETVTKAPKRVISKPTPSIILKNTFGNTPFVNASFPPRKYYPSYPEVSKMSSISFERGNPQVSAHEFKTRFVSPQDSSLSSASVQSSEANVGRGSAVPLKISNSDGNGDQMRDLVDTETGESVQEKSKHNADVNGDGKVKVQNSSPKRVIYRQPLISQGVNAINNNNQRKHPIGYSNKERKYKNNDYQPNGNYNENEKEDAELDYEGIMSYYQTLKGDIYEILHEVQRNQVNAADNSVNEVHQKTPQIDLGEVIEILRNFRRHGKGHSVSESTLYNIARMILRYINDRDTPEYASPSSAATDAITAEQTGHFKEKNEMSPNLPSVDNLNNSEYEPFDEDYEYYYTYYDETGQEFTPTEKHKIVSPSNEFTKEFLSKHTSRLSSMLTSVLKTSVDINVPTESTTTTKKSKISLVPSLTTLFSSESLKNSIINTRTRRPVEIPISTTQSSMDKKTTTEGVIYIINPKTRTPVESPSTTTPPANKKPTTPATISYFNTKTRRPVRIPSSATPAATSVRQTTSASSTSTLFAASAPPTLRKQSAKNTTEDSKIFKPLVRFGTSKTSAAAQSAVHGNQLFKIPSKIVYEDVYPSEKVNEVSFNQLSTSFFVSFTLYNKLMVFTRRPIPLYISSS